MPTPNVLWAGGEDLDFQQGIAPTVITSPTTLFRSSYARCAIRPLISSSAVPAASISKSNQFLGGAITSGWLSFRLVSQSAVDTNQKIAGFGQFSSTKCLIIGTGVSTAAKCTLYTFDGTTLTALAAESGASLVLTTVQLQKIDIQVVNYGASSTINVWVDGVLVITFSGDCTVSGMTNMDCVVCGPAKGTTGGVYWISEGIVADGSTLTMSLLTQVATGAGDTDDWTGTVTNTNPTTINDANVVNTNTTAKEEDMAITDPPTGTFAVLACLRSSRAYASPGTAVTKLRLGWRQSATTNVDAGQTASPAWTTYQRLALQNPITSADWANSELTALQNVLQSLT